MYQQLPYVYARCAPVWASFGVVLCSRLPLVFRQGASPPPHGGACPPILLYMMPHCALYAFLGIPGFVVARAASAAI